MTHKQSLFDVLIPQPALDCLLQLVQWRNGDADAVLLAGELQPHARLQTLSQQQCQQVLHTACDEMNEPALGLYWGNQWLLSCHHWRQQFVYSCNTVGAVLEQLCARFNAHMPRFQLQLDHHADLTRVAIETKEQDDACDDMLLELCISLTYACLTYFSDDRCRPIEIQLQSREPHHQALYPAFFHCPVNFHCAHNQILFRQQDLQHSVADKHPGQKYSDKVRWLFSHVRGHYPTCEQAAEPMALSGRTLRRRLHDEGTSYQQLLEQWRQQRAQHLLLHTHLSVQQVGYVLGYSDPANFGRAFRHWFNRSPRRYRQTEGTLIA
ncbi:hypothetical protein CHH28_01140 [Bacterioplanes sanyensis]|uniref:HTH araC/xylS-type domain-containing protein n=1 Tax=Bacterioplanes sanyensis TaxID=1249553 RepID=A0A222FF34_9GAMM|nr:AraC family transcriptional regulator [Bacterioplanes sanyensis]ASP37370.1 hypothetical protein CHH28_01140 [Bacterioplanes sanyensis]